jgi:hypothetical protein
VKPLVDQVHDVLDVHGPFKAVADDILLLIEQPPADQVLDDGDVEGGRSFEVDLVLERFFQDETEIGTFGAVTIVVVALVINLGHCNIEQYLGLLYLGRYLGEITYFQWSTILLDDIHQRDIMKIKFIIFNSEFLLGEVKGLFNEIAIFIFHMRLF